uniref:Uncharacterized protein n=1 Tax=viral metagenome TaxID=1070528 RepID=A0A6C0E3A0_9ZZZZ
MKTENQEDCSQIKTMKYKNIISNSLHKETKSSNDLSNLDTFLENEKKHNIAEPWSKLDKTVKIKKMLLFAEQYKKENQLEESEYEHLLRFLKDCLDRKKLNRVKDVTYDKSTGFIKDIPGLFHNKVKNHFTIKNLEKHVSTLKSLAPKKTHGTVKNIMTDEKTKQDSDEED